MTVAAATAAFALEALASGRRVAAAVLVETAGSTPFATGALLVVDDRGHMTGSVSGGCIEGVVAAEALDLLAGRRAGGILEFTAGDDLTGMPGLACGGQIRVLLAELAGDEAVAFLTAAAEGGPTALSLRGSERDEHFCLHYRAGPRLVIVGASDHAAALVRVASAAGYRTFVCDPRTALARPERFAQARVLARWPREAFAEFAVGASDAIVVMSHDAKLDEPALLAAVEAGVGYIGALGSRGTAAARRERLRALGMTDDQLLRIQSPCGLDLGGSTPEETAISILAQIVAVARGRAGRPLSETTGPLHGPPAASRSSEVRSCGVSASPSDPSPSQATNSASSGPSTAPAP